MFFLDFLFFFNSHLVLLDQTVTGFLLEQETVPECFEC